MSESLTQGLPFLQLGEGIKLFKSNDVTFTDLKPHFNCNKSSKKPDQFIAYGKNILVGIEDKKLSGDIEKAIKQIKDNYLDPLSQTKYFIARAGERTKVFFRIASSEIVEIGTTLRGKEVVCFGPRIITGENMEVQKNLAFLCSQILAGRAPVNGSLELLPPKEYYNPLVIQQATIFNLWQKIFACTGENAHTCLETFVELLLFKGLSDTKRLLPEEYSIDALLKPSAQKSLNTYKNTIRQYIKTELFPSVPHQPGVINGFAFNDEETVFKAVLKDLDDLGNLAQKQIDPDFKRRVIEAFLGSAHREGTIKNGKHLTPRIIIQAIWEMSDVHEGKRIVDPACGVGGFVLEGLNYPYEFDPLRYTCIGIDRDEQMIIVAKANMILHLLDKCADPSIDIKLLSAKVNGTFIQAKNNGTGTLGELKDQPDKESNLVPLHPADYVFANVPFYVNGVKQIDDSLKDLGCYSYYEGCGIGIESRFVKYILGQIKDGDPGIAFIIITDGILYRHRDKIRDTINANADVIGLVSLPEGIFQNNNWKTSILMVKRKSDEEEFAPVFIYNVDHIGISLDTYRTPIQDNDIPGLKKAWQQRTAGSVDDPKCRFVPRADFLKVARWAELFAEWRREDTSENISYSEFIENASVISNEIGESLRTADRNLGEIFALDSYTEIALGDEKYFNTNTPKFKATVGHARLHIGKYPLFSSQVDGPVEHMEDANNPPILIENEKKGKRKRLISWNIKGYPCKDIRVHTEPFYATENRGLIEVIDSKIDFDYLLYYLKEHLIALGNFKRSDEAHAGKVKSLKVKIPVDVVRQIDTAKQKEIARNYEKMIELRKNIEERISDLNNLLSNIDVFKQ